MNLANKLTIFRVLLIPVFVFFLITIFTIDIDRNSSTYYYNIFPNFFEFFLDNFPNAFCSRSSVSAAKPTSI